MNDNSKEKYKTLFSSRFVESTSIIAVITVFFYLFSYAFKLGYYSYFNIPSYYVKFDMNNIAPFGSFFIALALMILFLLVTTIVSIILSDNVLKLDATIEKNYQK